MVRAIGNNNDSTINPSDGFTPQCATLMLPLIRAIVADMVDLTESIKAQREQLEGIDDIEGTMGHDSYRDELRDIRGSIDDDLSKLNDCAAELRALGVHPHEPFDGSVDFPATFNRQPISLCWRIGEETVSHWHDNRDSRERQKIDAQAFGAESVN